MRELDLVEWIKRQKHTQGIGDDCYIQGNLVFTTDLMVEGVHFRRTDKPEFVGEKTLARGLSDIAAMGADPSFCLLSLARPKWADDKWVKAFFRGVLKHKVPLAGGDLSSANELVCDIVVCGQTPAGKALRRDTAKPGDHIYVSGTLGANARDNYSRMPKPRLELGRKLRGRASACMDLSDGLSIDLHRLCKASGVAADLTQIPTAKGATIEQALHGGEDYELLFTSPKPIKLPGVVHIGNITKGKPGLIRLNGKPLKPAGFEHFR
jgi:thiamine-monophosphate kinase